MEVVLVDWEIVEILGKDLAGAMVELVEVEVEEIKKKVLVLALELVELVIEIVELFETVSVWAVAV